MFIPESCLLEFVGRTAIVNDAKPWEKTLDSFCLGRLTRIVGVDRVGESADYLVTPLGLSEEDAWVYRVLPQWLVIIDSVELELANCIFAADSKTEILGLNQNPVVKKLLSVLHYSYRKKFDDVLHPSAKVTAKPAKKSQHKRW